MASSNYRILVQYLRKDAYKPYDFSFPTEYYFEPDKKPCASSNGYTENLFSAMTTPLGEAGTFLVDGDTHGCRETVISSYRRLMHKVDGIRNPFWNMKVTHILYFKENYLKLTDEKIKLIKELMSHVRTVDYGIHISFVQWEGKECVQMSFTSTASVEYYMSWLFWIFRNDAIMVALLAKGGFDNMQSLAKVCTDLFLRNPDFGDVANPALVLSIFSYALYRGLIMEDIQSNGPVNHVVYRGGLGYIARYFKEVLLPLDAEGLELVRSHTTSIMNLYRSFAENFFMVLDGMYALSKRVTVKNLLLNSIPEEEEEYYDDDEDDDESEW